MKKICKRCNEEKLLDSFSLSSSNKGGRATLCKSCVMQRNREYWRTAEGRISQIYSVQKIHSKQRKHPVPTYSLDELKQWAYAHGLEQLIADWCSSQYQKELIPSIDRINPSHGYSLTNIRLVTWAENNEKAYEDRKTCNHVTRQNKRVEQLTIDGQHIAFFDSIAFAARSTGVTRTNINAMCKGRPYIKSVQGYIWRYAD